MFKKIAILLLAFVLILQASVSSVAFADEYEAYEEAPIVYEVEDNSYEEEAVVEDDIVIEDDIVTDDAIEDDVVTEDNIGSESNLVSYIIDRVIGEAYYEEIEALNSVVVTTAQQLNSAILTAGTTPLTITVNNTINLTSQITISQGRHITIQGSGSITVSGHHRHFVVQRTAPNESSLTLAGDITLTRAAEYNGFGGGVRVVGGNNATLGNTHLTLRDNAAIINNASQVEGGGVHLNGGTLNLHDNSRIDGNTTLGNGGGVSATHGNRCGVNMFSNSSISNNTAVNGGGIIFGSLDDFVMHGGRITGNTATINGGGIIAGGGTTHLHMINGQITGNTAANDGGGIHAIALGALAIEENMVFNNNSARAPFDYGLVAGARDFPFIRWSGQNSLPGTHLLNNYDINFTGETIVLSTVTFDGNGGIVLPENAQRIVPTGTGLGINMPVNPIHPEGFDFLGWVIAGTTTSFVSTSIVGGDITVQAQWSGESIPVVRHDVTFALDGGDGYFPTQSVVQGQFAARPTTYPTRDGFTFLGWFVGNATTEFNFETTPITGPITITARWNERVIPTHDVTFYLDGGTGNFPPQSVEHGGFATAPTTEPVREGFNFLGWFVGDATTEFNFVATPIEAAVVLTARWVAVDVDCCENPYCDCEDCDCDENNDCNDVDCRNPDCDCEDCDCDENNCCCDVDCRNPDCDCENCECDTDTCCNDVDCECGEDCDCCECDVDCECNDNNRRPGPSLPQTGAVVASTTLAGAGASFLGAGAMLWLKNKTKEKE